MKKIIILLIIGLSLYSAIYSASAAGVTKLTGSDMSHYAQYTFKADPQAASFWFFEFKNKTKDPLHLTIICEMGSDYSVIDDIEVPASKGSSEKDHGYLRATEVPFRPLFNTSRAGEGRCYLLIRNEKNTFSNAWLLSPENGKTQFNWKQGRIYLTYEKGTLRLQEGTGTFSPKKTQSGLELKGWMTPTIKSIKSDMVVKKLNDIAKMSKK